MPTLRQQRQPTLIAEFCTPGDARAAIEALEHHGIDGLEIQVLNEPGEGRRQSADRRALVHLSGRIAKGAPLGALVGVVLFAVVGVAFVAAGFPAAVIVALMIAGIGLGAIVGAFWSVERGVGMSEDWEKTFQEPATAVHPMRVGVHTTSAPDSTRAREVLEDHHPIDVRTPT